MQILPFTSDNTAQVTTTLGGIDYDFVTRYNEASGAWSFDMSLTKSGKLLVAGVPVLIGCELLAPYGLGIGSMFAVDLTASAAAEAAGTLMQSTDAGPDDFGTRVIVVYLAPGEAL